MNSVYLPWLEWDMLDERLDVKDIVHPSPFTESVEKISVTRNDDYGLNAEATGKHDNKVFYKVESPSRLKGEQIPLTTVHGKSPADLPVVLSIFYEGRTTFRGKVTEQFYVKTVEIGSTSESEPEWFSIWCLNGPGTPMVPPRGTRRVLKTNISRTRGPLGKHSIESDQTLEASGGGEANSRDYWSIENSYFKLRLCKVPDAFGPKWSQNVAVELIEYPNYSFSLVDAQAILGTVGFIFGSRLVPVGCSWFSDKGSLIRSQSFVPWGTNLREECSQPAMPPIRLQSDNVEQVVGHISEVFFRLSDELDLAAGMTGYWLSRIFPAEAAFASIASGLESVMNAWFRSKKSRSQALYLPQAKFDAATAKPLCQIEHALAGEPYAERIMRRLRQTNAMGANERFERFFEEIELPIGEVEQYAISVRNRFVHGARSVPTEKVHNLVYALRAYQTLFHRILLKLSGYQGPYIDYSCLGFPERRLLEPLAGPGGDGKPLAFS